MSDHFWLGMAVIFVSGALNGAFALPMKYTRRWKWENTWLVFAALALLIIPWLLAVGLVPQLGEVYRGVRPRALLSPLLFGFFWGIAQVTYGLGISAVGMALAVAVVAGLCCLSGSLIPLLVLTPADVFRPQGILLLLSMPILFAGLILYGMAGYRREKEQTPPDASTSKAPDAFMTGLAICVFTGIFGANINLGFAFSGDVARKGLDLGASPVTSTYAVWALVLGAGFLPNLLYCCQLLTRNGTWLAFGSEGWLKEAGLSAAMALLWLSGILGYGIGTTFVGRYGTSLGFALFITVMILSSNALGIVTGEWKATSSRTKNLLAAAVAVILLSVVVINLGGLF
jgi:L-rhamnose-H+ transport protein